MENYYVYGHFALGETLPFYIGKGVGRRAWSTYHRSTWWKNVVTKHGYVVQLLAEGLDPREASALECFLIAAFGRRDVSTIGTLVNLTAGGEGTSGRVCTEATREKMRAGCARRPTVTAETRTKLSAAGKGRLKTEEHRKKIGESRKGKPRSKATKERISAGNLGKVLSVETRLRMSRSKLGIAKSVEHRQHIAAAKKLWWANKKAQQEA